METETFEDESHQFGEIHELNYFDYKPDMHKEEVNDKDDVLIFLRNPAGGDNSMYYVHLKNEFGQFFILNVKHLAKPGVSFKIFGSFSQYKDGFKIVIDSKQNFILFFLCQTVSVSQMIKNSNQNSKISNNQIFPTLYAMVSPKELGIICHNIFGKIFNEDARSQKELEKIVETSIKDNLEENRDSSFKETIGKYLMKISSILQDFYKNYFIKNQVIYGKKDDMLILKNVIKIEKEFYSEDYKINGRIDLLAECDYYFNKSSTSKFNCHIIIELKTGFSEYFIKDEEQVILYSMTAIDKKQRCPVSLLLYTHSNNLEIKKVYNNSERFRDIMHRRNDLAKNKFILTVGEQILNEESNSLEFDESTNATRNQKNSKLKGKDSFIDDGDESFDKENSFKGLGQIREFPSPVDTAITHAVASHLIQIPQLIQIFNCKINCTIQQYFSKRVIRQNEPVPKDFPLKLSMTVNKNSLPIISSIARLLEDNDYFILINAMFPDKKLKAHIDEVKIDMSPSFIKFDLQYMVKSDDVEKYFGEQKYFFPEEFIKNWLIYFKIKSISNNRSFFYKFICPEDLTIQIQTFILHKKLKVVMKLPTSVCQQSFRNLSRRLITVNPTLKDLEQNSLERLFLNRSMLMLTYNRDIAFESFLKILSIFMYLYTKRLNRKVLIVFKHYSIFISLLNAAEGALGRDKYLKMLSFFYNSNSGKSLLEEHILDIVSEPKIFFTFIQALNLVPKEDLKNVDTIILVGCAQDISNYFDEVALRKNKLIFIDYIDSLDNANSVSFVNNKSLYNQIFEEIALKEGAWIHL
jgi:hypothetical protein